MLWLELQRLEDQEIERSLYKVDGLDGLLPMIIDTSLPMLLSIIKGKEQLRANHGDRASRVYAAGLAER